MSNDDTVMIEEFIQSKVLPEYRPIIDAFRKFVRNEFPELKEEMRGGTEAYYSVPVYRLNRIVLTLSPSKHGITFAFSQGRQFEDKYKMLEGVGNKTLNIRLGSLDDFDKDKMHYYVRQAVDLDKE